MNGEEVRIWSDAIRGTVPKFALGDGGVSSYMSVRTAGMWLVSSGRYLSGRVNPCFLFIHVLLHMNILQSVTW
jgi:hypothetical protein